MSDTNDNMDPEARKLLAADIMHAVQAWMDHAHGQGVPAGVAVSGTYQAVTAILNDMVDIEHLRVALLLTFAGTFPNAMNFIEISQARATLSQLAERRRNIEAGVGNAAGLIIPGKDDPQ